MSSRYRRLFEKEDGCTLLSLEACNWSDDRS